MVWKMICTKFKSYKKLGIDKYILGYIPEGSITQSDTFCFSFNLLSYEGCSSLLLEHSDR